MGEWWLSSVSSDYENGRQSHRRDTAKASNPSTLPATVKSGMREARPAAISTKAITSATITRARLLMASVLDGCSRFGTVQHPPIANESVWGCDAAGEAYCRESSLTSLAAPALD